MCLGSASRLLAYRLDRLFSFPLYKNYISTFLFLTYLRIHLLIFIFYFSLGTLPPSFVRPSFFSIFPLTRKVKRKGICAFLFFLSHFEMATHILKYWQEKWKFMIQSANMPLGETLNIFVNLMYCFHDC